MRTLTILFLFISATCLAQYRQAPAQPDSPKDTVRIALTEWQEAQFLAYEKAAKEISERQQYLLKAIIDFHKIKEESIQEIKLDKGAIVIRVKKG